MTPLVPLADLVAELRAMRSIPCLTAADRLEEMAGEIRRLEDAALALWAELPVEQCHLLDDESPALTTYLQHLHHSIGHEQAMVRVNVWAIR